MIHLDRNHPSPPTQNKHQILPTNPISWPARDDDYVKPISNSKGPMTPTDHDDPHQDSDPSSPASPADGNSASPARERSSSLSPAPSPRPPPADAQTAASTPLSELSPPPDDDDDDAAPTPAKHDSPSQQPRSSSNNRAKDAAASAPVSPPSRADDHDPKPSQQSSHLMPASSPAPPVDSIATPSAVGTEPTSPAPGDPKVNVMLELNEELLKVCMEFQKRKMALSEAPFQAYSLRLQSNLAWSASVVDRDRQPGSPIPPLPMMDPPPPVDFYPTERIQELYMELPTVFAKDIARRASTSSSPLKRERSDDIPTDMMNKRRDTGESKTMMPPPPIPSPVANAASPFGNNVNSNLGGMTNGSGVGTPPGGDPLLGPQNPMMGDPQLSAASRERTRQAQMRAAQQQGQGNRQMSPPSSNNSMPGPAGGVFPPGGGGGGGGGNNAIAGPSGAGGMPPGMPQHVQQMYAILTTPGHPFVQYMTRMVPNFDSLPIGAKLQNMLKAHTNIQRERQQNGQGGGGGPFPGGQTSPVSPIAPMGGGGGGGGGPNPMFVGNNNPGMDMRAMNSTPLPGGGGGGGGMNMGGMMSNGITPQQRQLMLMQQQRGGGGVGGPGNMNMSPQQQMMLQHQQQEQRMRMEQQQRMGMAAQQGGSPTHPGSPMMGGGDFPALRSNASIPGIARIARSPSDGGGGMTPRMTPTRGPSMGAEDFQRAMMQQQRGGMAGPGGGGFGPGGFPQQPSQGWNQNALQQQAMMGGGGGGGGGGYGMGMGMGGGGGPRPGSAYGGAPSPPGSGGGMGGGQNWGQGPGPGAYFAGSPGGGDLGMQRHMSGTPGPQMQQNASPDADFDAFNWG